VGRNFREDLINQGVVSAVISMPSGLLPHTNIGFSILILTPSKVNDTVKFVDLRVYTSLAIKLQLLTNLNEVLSLVLENNESKYTKNIPNTEIESSGYNLSPGKYVLDSDMQSIHKFLKNEKTSTLGQHVEIIRPRVHRKGIDSGLDVLEIGAADIPNRGYIGQPVKSTLLDEVIPKNFAKHNDIVVIAKGSTGKVGIVPSNVPESGKNGWILGQSAIILRVISDEIDPNSLLIYLRSKMGQSLLKNITSGSTIPFIKLSDLKELPIIVPNIETKDKINKALARENEISQQVKELQVEQLTLADGIWNTQVNT